MLIHIKLYRRPTSTSLSNKHQARSRYNWLAQILPASRDQLYNRDQAASWIMMKWHHGLAGVLGFRCSCLTFMSTVKPVTGCVIRNLETPRVPICVHLLDLTHAKTVSENRLTTVNCILKLIMHVIDKVPKAVQPKSDRDVRYLALDMSPGALISDLGVGLTDKLVNIAHFHSQNMIKTTAFKSILCELLLTISFYWGRWGVLLKNKNGNSKTINLVGTVINQEGPSPPQSEPVPGRLLKKTKTRSHDSRTQIQAPKYQKPLECLSSLRELCATDTIIILACRG